MKQDLWLTYLQALMLAEYLRCATYDAAAAYADAYDAFVDADGAAYAAAHAAEAAAAGGRG